MICRYVASDHPRLLRTHLPDCEDAACHGCQPCPERHCRRCTWAHVTVDGQGGDGTCGECLAEVRDDLAHCWVNADLLAEALTAGPDSTAAMLVGPSADVERWQRRHRLMVNAAVDADDEHHPARKALAAWMEDCRDERHPMWVLGTWEDDVRNHLDQPTDETFDGNKARAYLDFHLTRLAHDPEFGFEQLASELASCRAYLESAARNSRRPETGAPCIKCGRAHLVKDYGETAEDEIKWVCPKCGEWWTDHDYRAKIHGIYVQHADRLTASQIAATYRIPEGTVRRWASGDDPTVRKYGTDRQGRQLYDVADALATRDQQRVS